MCCIIVKPKNKNISIDYFENIFNNNPHGIGIMYSENNQLKVEKFFCETMLIDFFNRFNVLIDKELVIHFRYAVIGRISLNNVHPFLINFNGKQIGMVHNSVGGCGKFPPTFQRGIGMTGSEAIAHFIEKNSNPSFLNNQVFLNELNTYIGNNSRVVFLNNSGEITIFNESLGTIEDGVWYSNEYFKEKNMRKEILPPLIL